MRRVWLLPAVFLAVPACDPDTATVSGRVTYQGKPLTSGSVTFCAAEGRVEHGLLRTDGSYAIERVPVGPARVAVASHTSVPVGLRGSSAPAEKPVALPARYRDPDQSGIEFTVEKGRTDYDIELGP
jgi:hypothetical protein